MSAVREVREFGTALSQLSDVLSFVESFLERIELFDSIFEIQLAVEEWYVNIVNHGFGGKNEGQVRLEMAFAGDWLEIEVADNGPAFDPHSLPPPEKPKSVEEAQIGGLGVFFIRKLMDGTTYRRVDNKNIFIMRKEFSRGGG